MHRNNLLFSLEDYENLTRRVCKGKVNQELKISLFSEFIFGCE